MKRTLSLVAFGAALAVLLSGCGLANLVDLVKDGSSREAEATPEDEADSDVEGVPAELLPYYGQHISWRDCRNGMECATLSAPMDWSNPSPTTDIELALVRQPATGTKKLGSLFVNPGGPGASGADFVFESVDFAASKDLQESFDIIGWDPRGVGGSTQVHCYDDAALDEFIFGIPSAAPGSQAFVDEVTQDAIAFGQACLEETGEVLQFIDTLSTVKDLDMMRAVVGDKKLHYLGYSYGSEIAAYYIENFPDKVGRVVADGATDPSLSLADVSLTQDAGFQRALENYLAECPKLFKEDCPFTGDKAADLATIRGLYDRYDASPIAAPDGRMMGGSTLDTAVATTLYSQDYWQYLNLLFEEAMVGETSVAFRLADLYYDRNPDGTYASNSLEAFLAIYCVNYPVERDQAALAEFERKRQEASPTTYLPSLLGDPICGNWPYQHQGPANTTLTGADAPPVLIVATTGDPATPYEWGVSVANQLESAQLITFNGEGHTAYGQGNECITSTVDDYFLTGAVPSSDPNC